MEPNKLTALAEAEGFTAAVLPADQVPVNWDFRRFCEENRCGQYGANYSCPPTCGTVADMEARIRRGETALVVTSQRPIDGYQDTAAIAAGKRDHNAAMMCLRAALNREGCDVTMLGGSCCNLCTPCRMGENLPCPHPEQQFSCVSAYCVDVAELARRCGLEFTWDKKKLTLYGVLILRPAA